MAKKIRCTFDLVTHFNDGRLIEPETFLLIKRVLDQQFLGYKLYGPFEGSWMGQVETSFTVEVRVLRKDIPRLRRVIVAIGHALGQKQMDMDTPSPSVESIGIEEEPREELEDLLDDEEDDDDDETEDE